MTRDLSHFYNLHAGETCLLVGNGENLHLTPPEWFDYPAFGMNTIHKYEGWKPTYYTAVDHRLMREFGKAVYEKFADIPKFIPRPNLDRWQGENFYRFYHRPGPLWEPRRGGAIWREDALDKGITYANIMHVAMQIAAWMGFTTLLIVGMQHKANAMKNKFWGVDDGMGAPPTAEWLEGYRQLREGMATKGIQIFNISQETYVPEDIIPRDDWQKWRTYESQNA